MELKLYDAEMYLHACSKHKHTIIFMFDISMFCQRRSCHIDIGAVGVRVKRK